MVSNPQGDHSATNRLAGKGKVRDIHSAAARSLRDTALTDSLNAAHVEIAGLKASIAELERRLHTLSRREARARHLANHDTLTGLPNRTLLQDCLHQALARAKRHGRQLALLFIDLDGFKGVNDDFGHLHGDKLLQAVGGRLTNCIRAGDTPCRFGGDEFVVLLTDIEDEQTAGEVAAKIKARLAEPYFIDNAWIRISCSIGSAVYPRDADDSASLMDTADHAMYRFKRGLGG